MTRRLEPLRSVRAIHDAALGEFRSSAPVTGVACAPMAKVHAQGQPWRRRPRVKREARHWRANVRNRSEAVGSAAKPTVLLLNDLDRVAVASLLRRYGLSLEPVAPHQGIPGSYWGESEAGLKADRLYARPDTPIHSILHESCHYICMSPGRRAGLDTDAGGDDLEESAVCYLQILLADELPGLGRARLLADMDAWGYSFRLGSARAWFEQDAEDARLWLRRHGLIDGADRPAGRRRA